MKKYMHSNKRYIHSNDTLHLFSKIFKLCNHIYIIQELLTSRRYGYVGESIKSIKGTF